MSRINNRIYLKQQAKWLNTQQLVLNSARIRNEAICRMNLKRQLNQAWKGHAMHLKILDLLILWPMVATTLRLKIYL